MVPPISNRQSMMMRSHKTVLWLVYMAPKFSMGFFVLYMNFLGSKKLDRQLAQSLTWAGDSTQHTYHNTGESKISNSSFWLEVNFIGLINKLW